MGCSVSKAAEAQTTTAAYSTTKKNTEATKPNKQLTTEVKVVASIPLIQAFEPNGSAFLPTQPDQPATPQVAANDDPTTNSTSPPEPLTWVILPAGQLPPDIDASQIKPEYLPEEIVKRQEEEAVARELEKEARRSDVERRLEGVLDAEEIDEIFAGGVRSMSVKLVA
ncbi:hypothetical protein HDU81_007736 [Chytriomyces hyalinus]|nr:hypothetical protein HDU81_007736 [Chytriomyces hyalinus]